MTTNKAIEFIESIKLHNKWAPSVKEAFDMAISALRRRIPRKVIDHEIYHECPVCKGFVSAPSDYCENCGQAIKWEG